MFHFFKLHPLGLFAIAALLLLFAILSVRAIREPSTDLVLNPLGFSVSDITDLEKLAAAMRHPAQSDALSKYLSASLSASTQSLLSNYTSGPDLSLQHAIVTDLNRIIEGGPIYKQEAFKGTTLSEQTLELLSTQPHGHALISLNRSLIVESYPQALSKGLLLARPMQPSTGCSGILRYFQQRSVGVVFPLILGIFSLAGFLATLSKLEERSSKITSLYAFLEHANEIIEETLLDKEEELWVVCHSPFIGNLTLRRTDAQLHFAAVLEKAITQNIQVNLVCLNPEAMGEYYLERFADDPEKRYSVDLCKQAFQEMRHFLELAVVQQTVRYYGTSALNMPANFIVANSREGVLGTLSNLPQQQVPSTSAIPTSDNISKVDAVGFYSRDPHLIDKLISAARYYASVVAAIDDVGMVVSAYDKWAPAERKITSQETNIDPVI